MANRRFTKAAKTLLEESRVYFKDFFGNSDIDQRDFRTATSKRGVAPETFRSLVEKINAMNLRRELDDSPIVLDPVEHSEPGEPPRRDRRSRRSQAEPTGTLRDTVATSADEAVSCRRQFEKGLAAQQETDLSLSELLLEAYLRRLIRRFDTIDLPLRLDRPELPTLESLYIDLPLVNESALAQTHPVKAPTFVGRVNRQAAMDRDYCVGPAEHSLAERLAAKTSTLILGAPGCGKSTLLAFHIVQLARLALSALDRDSAGAQRLEASLPVVLLCRDLIGVSPCAMKTLLLSQLERMGFVDDDRRRLAEYLAGQLGSGCATLFVDGLDEIPTAEVRRAFCRLVVDHERASGFAFCITSRPVGFSAISDLFPGVESLSIGPLLPHRQSDYLEKWAALEPTLDSALLRERIVANAGNSRLGETALTLALLVQLCLLEPQAPTRRIDIFRRTIRAIIERQRIADGQSYATFNEVQPHLGYLAYQMRARPEPEQYVSEDEVWRLFSELRDRESDEAELGRHSPQSLLEAIIDRIGLLSVVGTKEDRQGFDRKVIQFFHHLFQEYFVSQAIIHGRAGLEATVSDRIRSFLKQPDGASWSLTDRPMPLLGNGNRLEPVIAEPWHEAISLAIASLDNSDNHAADDALRAIVPGARAPVDVRRACATLALHTLADEPFISDECALQVFSAATNELRREDGFDTRNSLMDIAVSAVSRTRFGDLLRDHLLRLIAERRGQEQIQAAWVALSAFKDMRVGFDQTAAEGFFQEIQAGDHQHRVEFALRLAGVIEDSLPDLFDEFVGSVFHQLLSQVVDCGYQPLRLCLLWNASLLVSRGSYTFFKPVSLSSLEVNLLLALASQLEDDDPALAFIANLLSYAHEEASPFYQRDWLKRWDAVASGDEPQCNLPKPELGFKTKTADVLIGTLKRATAEYAQERISVALGAMGVFSDGMAESLMRRVRDDYQNKQSRDEALFYLTNSSSSRSTQLLLDGISLSDNPLDVSYRCTLGLLAIGEPESLSETLLSSTTEEHQSAFAFGLAGIADPRGRQILRQLASHDSRMVRESAIAALKKAEIWGCL